VNYYILGWFAIMFFLERLTHRFVLPTKISNGGVQRWGRNGILYGVNHFLGSLLIVPILYWASHVNLWFRPLWALSIPMMIVDVMILDVTTYALHQLMHRTPLLWRFHEIHHLDAALDSTTSLRNHFLEPIFLNLVRAIPIVLFSIPLSSALLFEMAHKMIGASHHSNIVFPKKLEKFLAAIFVTPLHHYVHHHALVKDTDSNYGFVFIWWDKLFGSFNKSQRTPSWQMGLEYSRDLNFFELLISPFKLKMLKERKKD
jgi:sterol desaturase/sphingolipid hydroxylase (fatty acid hydroxylase superfamily)